MASSVSESIYLDYNATTPLDPDVLFAITAALEHAWGNPSSLHDVGVTAKALVVEARQSVAQAVGGHLEDIVFTSGGTEANNIALYSGLHYFRSYEAGGTTNTPPGGVLPHFVTSNIEHDSVRRVLDHFQSTRIAEVTFVPVDRHSGRLEVDAVLNALRPNTCMVSVMMANHETGLIQPVAEISRALREARIDSPTLPRILLHTDAAQTIGKVEVSVDKLGVDFLTIVGQKFYGPRIGALYARKPSLIHPIFYGGGQERNYRPGTENTGMIAGLGVAARLVVRNLSSYEDQMRTVRDHMERLLQEEFGNGVQFNNHRAGTDRLPNTCNVSFMMDDRLTGSRVLAACQRVQASIGAACHSALEQRCSAVLLASGVSEAAAANAVRLSVGRTTTTAAVTAAVDDLRSATKCVLQELDAAREPHKLH